jgi:hypothetical protein
MKRGKIDAEGRMMQTLEAQVVDDTHLRLLQPIQLPSETRVIITVMRPDDDERETWLQASLSQLSRAYGDDEPEYSLELVKQPNPEFAA